MEEKVLIKSVISKKTRGVLLGATFVVLAIALVFFVSAFREGFREYADAHIRRVQGEKGLYECLVCADGEAFKRSDWSVFKHIWKHHLSDVRWWAYGVHFFFLHWIFLALAIVGIVGCALLPRCTITVTESTIAGRTWWGRKVFLPMTMVSAYATHKLFSRMVITTASGEISFFGIGNTKEIAEVLRVVTETRSEGTEEKTKFGDADELRKWNDLLLDGIITQDEFDAKKKEILSRS